MKINASKIRQDMRKIKLLIQPNLRLKKLPNQKRNNQRTRKRLKRLRIPKTPNQRRKRPVRVKHPLKLLLKPLKRTPKKLQKMINQRNLNLPVLLKLPKLLQKQVKELLQRKLQLKLQQLKSKEHRKKLLRLQLKFPPILNRKWLNKISFKIKHQKMLVSQLYLK